MGDVARAFANAAPERLPSLAEFVIDHDGGFGADGVLCLALALCQHHHFDRATETLAKHNDLLKIANKSEMLKLRRLELWLDKFHNASNFEPHSVKSDWIGIGVLSYREPGHNSSRKIGVCIQSLAVIAQLAKHFQTLPNSYFDGELDSTLDAVARQMDIKKPAGSVSVFAADRDGISSTQFSCHGWPLCYGWHAHHEFMSDYDHRVPAHIHPFFFVQHFRA